MTAPKLARERRDGWATEHRLVLTSRDVAILYAIGRCRALRTRDVVALAFGSTATARDRLRRLFVAGLLACHAPELATENIYTLTEAGKRVVMEDAGVGARELHVLRELPARRDHALGIARMRVLFTVATRLPSAPARLAEFRAEQELAAERHAGLIGVLPDALAEFIDASGSSTHLALEVDTGSEAPIVVRKKVERYDHYARVGRPLYGVDVRTVLVVAPGLRRLRSLARAIAALQLSVRVRFGDLDTLEPRTLFDEFLSARELVGSAQGPP